jgi:cell wall assembly regulator SMI1
MPDQLNLLDQQLRTKRPAYFAQLQPPLTTAEIMALSEKYQRTIPEPVQQLYRWKNGQAPACMEALVNNSMFISLEEALDTAADLTSMIGFDFEIENWWHPDWWPLFHNGGGDYICYDAGGLFTNTPGQLIEFWHADDDRNVIFPDLSSLISTLRQYYEGTIPADEEFFTITAPAGYPKEFRVA